MNETDAPREALRTLIMPLKPGTQVALLILGSTVTFVLVMPLAGSIDPNYPFVLLVGGLCFLPLAIANILKLTLLRITLHEQGLTFHYPHERSRFVAWAEISSIQTDPMYCLIFLSGRRRQIQFVKSGVLDDFLRDIARYGGFEVGKHIFWGTPVLRRRQNASST